jgi:hypothetical protein
MPLNVKVGRLLPWQRGGHSADTESYHLCVWERHDALAQRVSNSGTRVVICYVERFIGIDYDSAGQHAALEESICSPRLAE